jgi:hypothetical protein
VKARYRSTKGAEDNGDHFALGVYPIPQADKQDF